MASFSKASVANAGPGSGGFLLDLLAKLPLPAGWNISLPFALAVALGGWTIALLVMVLTKGRLGYRMLAPTPPDP